MRILILKNISTELFGTITLAGRLFHYFNKNGIDCYLSKFQESKIIDSYDYQNKVLPINYWNLKSNKNVYKNLNIDIIYCLASDDALAAFRLKKYYFKSAKIFIGVYHPRQFMVPTHFFTNYQEYLYTKIIKNIPFQNLIFMDEACKQSHQKYYKIKFNDSPIVPLPMEIKGKILEESFQKDKIVSVGRITNFKPYTFGVIRAIKKLKSEKGICFQYHIIGDGSDCIKLKKFVNAENMNEHVIFHGSIPYESINKIIMDAFCFIGMGTTVGEAAGIGLPSLVAIIDEEDVSYGLIGRLPNNILGEPGEDLELISFEKSLNNLYNLSTEEYLEEKQNSLKKSSFYAISNLADLFLNTFKNGKETKINISYLDQCLFRLAQIQFRFFLKKEYRYK